MRGACVILKRPNLSARIGVKLLLGGAYGNQKKPNQSAKIGVVGQWLLGGAYSILKKPSLSARIGVKLLLGGRAVLMLS